MTEQPPATPPADAAPRRFPRPTGRTAAPAFFTGAGLVLGTAVWTQANLLFWLFGLGVGGAVFALAHGPLALRGLHAERLPPGRCAAGAAFSLGYELRNGGPVGCFALRIRELGPGPGMPTAAGPLPWGWAGRVAAGASVRVSSSGVAPRRGEHPLTAFEVSTTFPLGLFRRRRVFPQRDTLRVLPELLPLAPDLVHRAARPRPGPDGVSARAEAGVEGDFYGTRGYRPGDPLRTLDWKRSARQGELMVRELATPEPPRVAVLLDLREPADGDPPPAGTARHEHAISLAASLVTRAHAAGFRVGLRVAGTRCPSFTPHHALAHRDRLLSALGRIDLDAPAAGDDRPPPARALREATAVIRLAAPGGGPDAPGAVLRFTASPASRGAPAADAAPGVPA